MLFNNSDTDSNQLSNPIHDTSNACAFEPKIDLEKLAETQKHFLKINDLRLSRVVDSLASSQKIFIDLLPLLFQLNQAELPGYSTLDVPTGVYGFKIDRQHIRSARYLNTSFNLPPKFNNQQDIRGIFLMGSCGSLGHTEHSDIDIWIVPRGGLSQTQREALELKCTAISEWAFSLALEVHFFVMDDTAFREQERADMNQEDCGTTQHFLLLDEFYRTSILIAGCQPLWWSVPSEQEPNYQQYTNALLEKEYINSDYCIDFGCTHAIPSSEFVSAGIWHLYKALGSPYKALMKLLLIEIYATEYPDSNNLCSQFKQNIYHGNYNLDELDPYLLVYRRIEKYLLARSETDRLELLRRCFYFKVGIQLSLPDTKADAKQYKNCDTKQWKRQLMSNLVAGWGWQAKQLAWLDQKENWPYTNIRNEQNKLTRELINSYRLLCMLVKNRQSESINQSASKELTLLGRQLYAAFEQKPHKIPQAHCTVVKSLSKKCIEFRLEKNNTEKPLWCADIALLTNIKTQDNTCAETPENHETIKSSTDIAELLVWCIANDLIDEDTRLNLQAGPHNLSEADFRQLFNLIKRQVTKPEAYSDYNYLKQQFSKPANITHCTLILNNKENSTKKNNIKSLDETSNNLTQNLSITLIATNNWNEIYCQQYSDGNAVNNCLLEYFSLYNSANDTNKPTQNIYAASASCSKDVVNRLKHLFDDIQYCFFNGKENAVSPFKTQAKRYIYELNNIFYVFELQQHISIQSYNALSQLLNSFSQKGGYGKAIVDRHALQQHPLNAIQRKLDATNTQASAGHFRSLRPEHKICVFYEVVDDIAHTYLTDQHQALGYAEIPYESTRAFILPMTRFIEQSALRRLTSNNSESLSEHSLDIDSPEATVEPFNFSDYGDQLPDIEFYALNKTGKGQFACYNTIRVPTESNISANYMSIKAIGVESSSGEISWCIHCNDQSFDQSVLKQQFFERVAKSILNHRQSSQQRYRCYITDIELTASALNKSHSPLASNSLIQDFYYKNQLEVAINNAFLLLPQ